GVEGLPLGIDDREVASPAGERGGGTLDRATTLELAHDRRDQERRELGAAVDADPVDLVTHADVREAIEHGLSVILAGMSRDLHERRYRLALYEALEKRAQGGHGHRLVDVGDTRQRREVRDARVTRIEHSELVLLPVVDAVGEQRPDVLP